MKDLSFYFLIYFFYLFLLFIYFFNFYCIGSCFIVYIIVAELKLELIA